MLVRANSREEEQYEKRAHGPSPLEVFFQVKFDYQCPSFTRNKKRFAISKVPRNITLNWKVMDCIARTY